MVLLEFEQELEELQTEIDNWLFETLDLLD